MVCIGISESIRLVCREIRGQVDYIGEQISRDIVIPCHVTTGSYLWCLWEMIARAYYIGINFGMLHIFSHLMHHPMYTKSKYGLVAEWAEGGEMAESTKVLALLLEVGLL